MSIKVLLVDDDALVRAGLKAVIDSEADLSVVGEASDGNAAIELAEQLAPDLVIMDIRMPGLDGLAATERILESANPPKVLVLTTFELDEYVYSALRVGAAGFLLKRASPEELLEAVRISATGESVVFPESMRRVVEHFVVTGESADRLRADIERLSERECEVLEHIARGLSNAEISDALFVSHETVKSHVRSLLTKLGVRDRTQAVIAAYESGFIRPGD